MYGPLRTLRVWRLAEPRQCVRGLRERGDVSLGSLGAVLKVGQEGGRLLLIEAKVNRGRAVEIMDPDVTPTGPAAAGGPPAPPTRARGRPRGQDEPARLRRPKR